MNETAPRSTATERQTGNGLNARGRYASPAMGGLPPVRGNAAARPAEHLGSRALRLTRQGVHRVRDSGERVHLELWRATDRAAGRVRQAPLRSVLLAVALGAIVYAVASRLGRRPD